MLSNSNLAVERYTLQQIYGLQNNVVVFKGSRDEIDSLSGTISNSARSSYSTTNRNMNTQLPESTTLNDFRKKRTTLDGKKAFLIIPQGFLDFLHNTEGGPNTIHSIYFQLKIQEASDSLLNDIVTKTSHRTTKIDLDGLARIVRNIDYKYDQHKKHFEAYKNKEIAKSDVLIVEKLIDGTSQRLFGVNNTSSNTIPDTNISNSMQDPVITSTEPINKKRKLG